MKRISIEDIERTLSTLNANLVDVKLVLERRYNYFAIEIYDKYSNRLKDTLVTGSKRYVYAFVGGMNKMNEFAQFIRRENNG